MCCIIQLVFHIIFWFMLLNLWTMQFLPYTFPPYQVIKMTEVQFVASGLAALSRGKAIGVGGWTTRWFPGKRSRQVHQDSSLLHTSKCKQKTNDEPGYWNAFKRYPAKWERTYTTWFLRKFWWKHAIKIEVVWMQY